VVGLFVASLADIVIRHLVRDDKVTKLDFSHGKRWQRLRRYLIEGVLVVAIVSTPGLFRGKPQSESPKSDDGDTRTRFPLVGIIFGANAS
jgi:hypothetical protein